MTDERRYREQRRLLDAYEVRLSCEVCADGFMVQMPRSVPVMVSTLGLVNGVEHRCDRCGVIERLNDGELYPRLVYEKHQGE